MFEAYGLMRDAFEILRFTVPDQQYLNTQSDTFYHWLIDNMHSQLEQLLTCHVQELSGNLQAPQVGC